VTLDIIDLTGYVGLIPLRLSVMFGLSLRDDCCDGSSVFITKQTGPGPIHPRRDLFSNKRFESVNSRVS